MFSFSTDEELTGIVGTAAISAALALRLVAEVLEIAGRKQSSERVTELIRKAKKDAGRLAHLAREDGRAYKEYMRARRERRPDVQAKLRRAIAVPLQAAGTAAAAIELCQEALPYMRGAIAADICGATELLAGAVGAILCTVDVNLKPVEDEQFAKKVRAARDKLAARIGKD